MKINDARDNYCRRNSHISQYLETPCKGEQCQVFLDCTLAPFLLLRVGGRFSLTQREVKLPVTLEINGS